ncbi:Hypp1730 [Branchiostoma lanceolatum]|uniref:Hypp1730 protein n=1 Tax=Branchiostoma lanceolatum TaxID=7740 RepID=A0A8J9ZLF8_BRALA|nr:Hypp1730 [Branchiostoma lanceolatum]
MLRVCEKLREVDAKARRLGLVRTETDYLRALLDAMADMDSLGEVELLKSLGDVNLEKGRLGKNVPRFDRALVLYRAALLRCEDAEVRESLANRCRYAVELILGRVTENPWGSVSFELHTTDRKMSSPAKVAEKFLQLDLRFTSGCKRNFVLIEYTTLMIEGIVNEDNMLETEAIKSLGDVFLRRGAESRDTTDLTKATALYNTALARCEGTQGRVALIHRLLYTARVRQGMQRTGNKSSKFRQRQQQRGHLAVTPPSTDVIFTGKTEVQKFILPSDYISSQTPKHVPDFRSYEEYLIAGDRALTDGKLDLAERKFAAALNLIHDPNQPDRHKENDCLCRLGDVYLQRGKTTKAGRNFTRAAALYNAAMARTDKNKHSVTERLREIEQCLLRYTANVDSKSFQSDQAIRHQTRLEDIRSSAKSQLDAIGQQYDPYQYDEDDPCMKTVEAERAEAVKALFKNIAKDRQTFIRELVDECIAALGPPPCKYGFIGLGSQATELVTPYSDLEFAILIEDGNDNDATRRYFLNLTHYLHLKVINLGETILPAMAIPSLNDFQSEDPEKDWFFDSVTPRGFAFDGFMPWACKTPFGRDKTKMKSQVSLIQTPANMAQFQHLDISLSEGYHLSDILRRYVFLAGEEALVNEYEEMISEIITDGLLSNFQSRLSAMQILYENREQFFNLEPTGQLLNVKKDIYRFPGIAIELLALCCQITQSSAWDVIDRLKEMEKIQEENATHLTVLTSISAELRLRTYMANGGQKDDLSPLAQMEYQSQSHEVPDSMLKSVFYIPDTKVL